MPRPTLVPELCVLDLERSLRFYVDLLGFRISYQRPESGFAAIDRDGAHLMLEQTASCAAATDQEFAQGQWRTGPLQHPFGRGINLEITIADVQPVLERLQQAGHPLRLPVHEKWYRVDDRLLGVRQFLVQDPDGYLIRFAQDIGERPVDPIGSPVP